MNRISLFSFSLIASVMTLVCACATPPEQPRVEQPPPAEAAQPQATATEKEEPAIKLPPHSATDVRNAITRLYKNAVLIDSSRYCIGDFNGDGIQDIAVVVRPADGSLDELNSEVANWILEDPQKIVLPDLTRVQQSDTLLAVLHGFGPAGWRDPQARQTYLLRNVGGANMRTQQLADALKTVRGRSLMRLRGGVINESIAGETGFLYYTGAKYAWFRSADKTFASRK